MVAKTSGFHCVAMQFQGCSRFKKKKEVMELYVLSFEIELVEDLEMFPVMDMVS